MYFFIFYIYICNTFSYFFIFVLITFFYSSSASLELHSVYCVLFMRECKVIIWFMFCRTDKHTAEGDLVTVKTQTRICYVVRAVTTSQLISVWTRADERSTAAERLGCMVASSVAAWSVHKHTTDTNSNRVCAVLKICEVFVKKFSTQNKLKI